jgi:hypothetical protein
MSSYNGHSEDCICVPCMNADLDAHVLATQGQEALDRLNAGMAGMPRDTAVRTRYATPGTRTGRGIVRKVSERQVRFIKNLLATRDTRNLVRLPGSEDIENMSLAGARDLIDRLLACPEIPAKAAVANLATDKQKAFARSLAERKGLKPTVDFDKLTKAEISKIIDSYKAIADKPAEPVTPIDVTKVAGLYELGGDIYRMRKARTGQHFYAEKLTDVESSAFEYAAGMARKVPAEGRKLTLEECEALSLRMGGCCMCGRDLTATVDGVGPAARFIGPICAAKMGF